VAIGRYEQEKADAGGMDAPPELKATLAAGAVTEAAGSIAGLSPPPSPAAERLSAAVAAFAESYRELALAMSEGSYDEVMAAGDATEATGAEVASAAAEAGAPSCADMTQRV
jgi:hypothetical protein